MRRPAAFLLLLAAFALRASAGVTYMDDDQISARFQRQLERYNAGAGKTTVAHLQLELNRTNSAVALVRPETRERSWPEIYDRIKDSVLIVGEWYDCKDCGRYRMMSAAGFIIATNGIMVTNYHVVHSEEKAAVLGAMTFDGVFHPVIEILAASARDDVAIVRLGGTGFKPLPVLPGKPVGASVVVLSHPDMAYYSLTSGIISRYAAQPLIPHGRLRRHVMVVTADFARGSSGSPVIDNCGNVVGLASSTVSIYYNEEDGRQENLQQVIKDCVPASSILNLVSGADK